MRFVLVLLIYLLLCQFLIIRAQPNLNDQFEGFFDFKQQFNHATDAEKQELIDSYISWQTSKGFPAIVNDTLAVFIYYKSGSDDVVQLAGDMTGWSTQPLNNLVGYNFHYGIFNTYSDARVDYKFIVNDNWILDPRNPNTVSGGYGPNSELAMPGFVQPPEIIERNDIDKGVVEQVLTEEMTWTGPKPTLQVYTPAGYSNDTQYRTLYFTDGSEYLSLASTKTILDNLIADGRIEPVIAVFADPYGLRHEWYNCSSPRYLEYVDVLVPFIDARYSTNTTDIGRVHIGDSLGGQITAYIGLNRPEMFRLLGVHSGAFWDAYSESVGGVVGCHIKEQISNADDSFDLKFFLTAGYYETEIWQDTKTVESTLRNKQWQHEIDYLYEGHSWGQWRHTLDNMLEYLLNNNTQVTYTDIFPPEINKLTVNGDEYKGKTALGTNSHESADVVIELTDVTDESGISKTQVFDGNVLLDEGTDKVEFALAEGNHSLQLVVRDTLGNPAEMTLEIEIVDGFAPTFGEIMLDPSTPVPDKFTSISVEVIDPHLTTVDLYYSIDGEEYSNTKLSFVCQYWTGILPKVERGSTLNYYIQATDEAGNIGKSEVQTIVVTEEQSNDQNIAIKWQMGLMSFVPIILMKKKKMI